MIGVNPCVRVDQIPADFPDRERVWRTDPDDPEWVEPGNTVIVDPDGGILAGPARHEETVLVAELDLDQGGSPRGGCSTRSATTTARTCSGSPSTPHRAQRSPRWTAADRRLSVPSARAQVPQKVRYSAKSSGAGSA